MRTFSFLLPLMHQYPVMFEGLHQPWQSSGISVYLGLPSGRISPGDGTEQPVLSNPLCAAWSCPRHLGWVLQGNHLSTIYQPFIVQLLRGGSCVLYIKLAQEKITEWAIILWSLAVNLYFPKMFISYWRHKGKTAENCCLLSDCSLKTPLSIKEGKYCSLQVYGSHQCRDDVQGQKISCFTDKCSEAQEENDPHAKNNPQTNYRHISSQCQEGCAGSEHSWV